MSNQDLYIKKGERYDYNLKEKDDRAIYIEDRLSFIFKLSPDILMGYLDKSRDGDYKYDKIPKMIDAYTTYFLTSRGVTKRSGSEYPYYVNERDEKRNKSSDMINNTKYSMDSDEKVEFEEYEFDAPSNRANKEIVKNSYKERGISIDDSLNCDVLKYAINSNKMDKGDYRKLLSMSGDILLESNDEELIDMVEQIVFNCSMNCSDITDIDVLSYYVQGLSLREISNEMCISHTTVGRKINDILGWIN